MSTQVYLNLVARIACFALLHSTLHAIVTSNSRYDPYPMYTSLDPHYFLYQYNKDKLKKVVSIKEKPEWFCISISPFGQNATCAKPHFKESCAQLIAEQLNPSTQGSDSNIEIGDLDGRWGMIGLLMGPIPNCRILPPSLIAARECLFPNAALDTPLNEPNAIDPAKKFGFFSIPIDYHKRGIRFEMEALLSTDVGVTLKLGVADICQTAKRPFDNLTCTAMQPCQTSQATPLTVPFDPNNPNLTVTNVDQVLMFNSKTIAKEIGLDIDNFHKVSAEDLRVGLFWRHAYPMNFNRLHPCFEEFLLYPFVHIEGSIPLGQDRPRNHAFALSFGSQDHAALGITGGLNFDFTETIEFGAEAGVSHFFCRDFCNVPMPTSDCQSGIYPFQTDVSIQPGNNAHFCADMMAYHFIGCLSFYFQYVIVRHEPDCICLKKPDCAFRPDLLEKRSDWTSQMANIGFNYDITPYISLGFLWQAPVSQRGAYRSTTVLFTFTAAY